MICAQTARLHAHANRKLNASRNFDDARKPAV